MYPRITAVSIDCNLECRVSPSAELNDSDWTAARDMGTTIVQSPIRFDPAEDLIRLDSAKKTMRLDRAVER